jgi:class 3 adenylate cyclase
MSESLQPEELVDVLNQYLTAMTEIVFRHGRTLDKYIGDAIKVFFGDPVSYEDHAARAVQMAIEMQAKLLELQHRWSVSQDEILTMGVGISTGYVTVGNIGSSTRLDYTVIGNHVNLASRLADRAKAGQILISERTLLAVRSLVESREIDEVELEGVARPIKIYEIRATRADLGAPAMTHDGI